MPVAGPVKALIRGGLSGAAATVPMSTVMLAAQKVGALGAHPPERITRRAIDRIGVHGDEEVVDAASVLLHFGFGAATGALYAGATDGRSHWWHHDAAGVALGLAVWGVSYAGWVPALGIMPPPDRDRPARPQTMILAHVVYGVVLVRLLRCRRPRGRGGSPPPS